MFDNMTVKSSSEENVWKYIFESDNTIAEAVLYRYESFENRTVICCSVQSGCPVGCVFCGTGKKFIRNLVSAEIIQQVQNVLDDKGIDPSKCDRFQIMFMSMGEPMLNWDNVEDAIVRLNRLYPNAQLLISTVGIKNNSVVERIIRLSCQIGEVGLQFSIHRGNEKERNRSIPFKNKMSLRELRDFGLTWHRLTSRPIYLNYCVTEPIAIEEENRLKDLFSPMSFSFTFSVMCNSDENAKEACNRDLSNVRNTEISFLNDGYNCRIFDPAGQDDIGGGCGQLWHVQNWLKRH
jgi:23S rRNA (adenine2503-C2)-methyltransferase